MGRSPCCDKNGLKKGPWTPEEDEKLIDYIQKNGCGNWRTLPKNAGLQRCGKSCRLRWTNYLRPDIKRGRFSFEEEETIIQLHSVLGNKWSAIAARLPGRTDNEIKNYWNTHIRKRLMRMGIDPVTHRSRLDLLDFSTLLNMNNSQSQMNLSRLLGMQNLINPELLRLATFLFSSHTKNQETVLMKNQMIINSNNSLIQSSQIQNHVGPISSDTTPCAQIFDQQNQLIMPYDDVRQLENNLSCGQFGQLSEYWQQSNVSMLEDYVPETTNGFYGTDQSVVNRAPLYSETSTFDSNGNNNFGFQSVLSTPNSSSTPLHSSSNSTYINSSCTTEDERESLLNFDQIRDILDINDYM